MAAFTTMAAIALGSYIVGKELTKKVPKPPTPLATPKVPETLNPDITSAVSKQRQMSTAGGRSSTLLTGPKGLTTEPPSSRKTLLGY